MTAMRNYLTYITCLLAAAFMSGCVKIDIQPVEQVLTGDLTSVTLQLKSSDLVATKVAGVDDLNENLIKYVQCFFYESDESKAVVFATDVIEIKDGEKVGKNGTVSNLKITIPSEKMTDLFSDNSCMVYVVANGPEEGIKVTTGATIDDVKSNTSVALEEYEIEGEGNAAISKAAAQPSFVMGGNAEVEKSGDTITGVVPLYRVAAKILVKLHVANKIVYDNGTEEDESDDVEWTPLLDQIRIKYINSVTGSKLDAEPGSADLQTLSEFLQQPYADYQVYDVKTGTTPVECTQAIPFYTYPYDWNTSSNPAPSISLLIPWESGDGINKTFEYQIPINPTITNKDKVTTETKSLVSNTVYEMTVNVGILGGLTGTVELSPSYIVTDWGTGTIDAELSRPKYLVVDETKVVMNNVETYSVKYEASDLVGFHVIENSIKKFTYSVDFRGNVTVGSGTTAVYGDYVAKLEEIKEDDKIIKYFTFSHELDNSRGPIEECDNQENYDEYDYLANEVVVRIFLKTEENTTYQTAEIYEDITFTQYPAMYIDPEESEGYVIINSNKSNTVGSVWWYNYGGFLNGENHYVVNVSAFDETTKDYQICDPRVSYNPDTFIFHEVNYNTDTDGNVENSTDVTGANLIGYRGTVEGSASRYLVAPSFMIASSAGAYNNTETLSAKCLQYRCAAYQEDGYPAGRWRLPTPAELEVVGKLCSEGKMESIFYDGLTYASSDGLYLYSNSGTFTKSDNKLSKSVRCVYDTWYWDDVCKDKSQFLWGAEGNIAALKYSQNYDKFFKSVE